MAWAIHDESTVTTGCVKLILAFFVIMGAVPMTKGHEGTFHEEQRRSARYRAAEAQKADAARMLFEGMELPYPPAAIFIRIFKKERLLELWATGDATQAAPVSGRSRQDTLVQSTPGRNALAQDVPIQEGPAQAPWPPATSTQVPRPPATSTQVPRPPATSTQVPRPPMASTQDHSPTTNEDQGAAGGTFRLVKIFPICAISGDPGPKRREGDGQTPEGFYYVDRFNPASKFHLALGINYPNRSDRLLGDRPTLGGDIFIHGGFVTVGCIPMTDELIKEIYVIAVAARAHGQERIPVHIFPRRLDATGLRVLEEAVGDNPPLVSFWRNLMVGYNFFETTRTLPVITVAGDGRYVFSPAGGDL